MGEAAIEQQTENNEVNVDSLLQEAYEPAGSLDAPNEGLIDNTTFDTTENSSPEVTQNAAGDFVINHKGKEITLDADKARSYAQQGYDYSKKMHQLRVDRKLFEQETEKTRQELQELQEINAFAKENPAFEQLIQREWAKVQAGGQLEVSPEDKNMILESRLNQVLERLNAQEQAINARKTAEIEAKQEGAIESYKQKHSDFDWNTKDENGATLEDRIMQSMIDKGIKDFEIMADHVLKKELMVKEAMQAKEQVARKIQTAHKQGLGAVTNKSQLAAKKAENVSAKSYDDLVLEGLKELGIDL